MPTAKRVMSFTTAQTIDADGIKTSIATVAAITTYSGAALNGAMVVSNVAYPRFNSKLGIASYPTVTSAAQASGYTAGSTVVFTGTLNGVAATSTATLAQANGNETQFGDSPLDSVTSITIGAQPGTAGSFTFGFNGLVPAKDALGRFKEWRVMAATAGNVRLGFSDGSNDTIAFPATVLMDAVVTRVYSDTAVTIYVFEN
jgi:hypothetical protein